MGKFRWILLVLVVVAMVVAMILTWGSIASCIFALALIMVIPIYCRNRYINRDHSKFRDDN